MAEQSSTGWVSVGTIEAQLVDQLTNLYWLGLKRELVLVVRCLKKFLRHPPDVQSQDESNADRAPTQMAAATERWNPLGLKVYELLSTVQKAIELAGEEQAYDWKYRAARSLLGGIGMFDIDQIVEYRKPILTSHTGDVQLETRISGNSNGQAHVEVLVTECDECAKPIRGSSFICTQACTTPAVGTGKTSSDRAAFQVCTTCYPKTTHPQEHLRKITHSFAISTELQQQLDDTTFLQARRECQRIQEKIDREQNISDGHRLRAAALRNFPGLRQLMFPLGNVHTGIMFGPLIIENGVQGSQHGVRMSLRHPPTFLLPSSLPDFSPTLALSPKRIIYQKSTLTSKRAIHASIKHVLGGIFSGHIPTRQALERLLVQMLLTFTETYEENPLKSRKYNNEVLDTAAEHLIRVLKFGLEDELTTYLRLFARKLFDKNLNLGWNKYRNNCQNFCKSFLDHTAFGTVFPPSPQHAATPVPSNTSNMLSRTTPNYLLSFLSPMLLDKFNDGGICTGPISLFFKDVHHEVDVIDSCETRLGRLRRACETIFMWPCQNEACSLAQHVWGNPYEFVCVLQLHLLRERNQYLAHREDEPGIMNDDEWIQNRRNVLSALDIFSSNTGAVLRAFRASLEEQTSENGGPSDIEGAWNPASASEVGRTGPLWISEGDSLTMVKIDAYPSLWERIRERKHFERVIGILPPLWPGINRMAKRVTRAPLE